MSIPTNSKSSYVSFRELRSKRASPDIPAARVSCSVIPDLAKGLAKSPTLRTIAVTTVVGGLAAGVLFLVVSSPPLWMIGAVIGGGIGVGLLLGIGSQLPFKGKQKLEFEYSALARLFKNQNYNEIIVFPKGGRILLGALPNRLSDDGGHLRNIEHVGAVLSVNEPWERDPVGLSLPYQKADWREMGVDLHKLDVQDHHPLKDDELNKAADFIHEQIQEGKNVYVHCRAGVGRSAMAIAAYLIKHKGYTVEMASAEIKKKRPDSTIYNKVSRLTEFERELKNPTLDQQREASRLIDDEIEKMLS